MTEPGGGSWFGRNWKWLVPVGCLGTALLLVGLAVGVVFLAFGAMKSSEVYQQALSRAQEHPAVEEAVGSPIKAGWLVSGNISVSGPSGEADLSIPISGPRGKARIYAVATRSAGRWEFSTLEVEILATGARITLLPSSRPAQARVLSRTFGSVRGADAS